MRYQSTHCPQLLIATFLLALGILGSGQAKAATIKAASCNQADVQAAIDSAASGDTVSVPAGNCTWSGSAVTIPVDKPLDVIGPGSNNLSINLNGHYAFTILPYIGTEEFPATRISGFKFISPLDAKYAAILAKGQGWRIDNCNYESIESPNSTTAGNFVVATGLNSTCQPQGVLDNNDIKNGKIVVMGASNYFNLSIAWADALDLGGGRAVYVEDNYFHTSIETNNNKRLVMDANDGGKYVFRYNTMEHCDILAHGLQAVDRRGTRRWEIYGNTFEVKTGTSPYYGEAIAVKAGTGVIFNNDATSAIPYSRIIYLGHERSGWSMGDVGACNGTSSWDENVIGQNGWLCRDQIGTGGDSSKWVTSVGQTFLATPPPSQIKTPAYFWANLGVAAPNDIYLYGTAGTHIKANRDYYNTVESFDGSNGVGCGTLANRPSACTPGVAYWATDQSCTDLSGLVGDHPQNPISGTLYKCVSEDTWESYYTPYTYPHPLRNEAIRDNIAPVSPTGLTVN